MTIHRALLVTAILLTLHGCIGVVPEQVGAREAALGMIAEENAAQGDPSLIGSGGTMAFVGEYSAFAWYGANGWETWLGARGRYEAQHGISGAKVSVIRVRPVVIQDGFASVTADVSLSYARNGHAVHERGTEVFSLRRYGEHWNMTGYARLVPGEIATGAAADNMLSSAQDVVNSINAAGLVPARLPNNIVIKDDFGDWRRAGPADPDLRIVLGDLQRLEIGRSDSFLLFAATLQSKSSGAVKGHGQLGLALGGGNPLGPGLNPWNFESIAWAPA